MNRNGATSFVSMLARRAGPALLLAALSFAPAVGQAPAADEPQVPAISPEKVAAAPVILPQTQEIAMRSSEGLDYRIFIYQPATPPPPGGFPVIYVLDGNAWFTPLAHSLRLMSSKFSGISPAVVVGIGYPGDAPFNQLRRFYDFIPDMPLIEKVAPGYTPPKIGGADKFLKFIQTELEPAIESRVKIDRSRRTLFGHSLGCSMTLHTLFTQPSAFQSYVCGSPSLHFNGDYILKEGDAFIKSAAKSKLDTTLIFYVAEYDQKVPPNMPPEFAKRMAEQLEQAQIVTGGRQLNERLQGLKGAGLKTTFFEFEGENHLSEVPVLINRMLPIILRPVGNE